MILGFDPGRDKCGLAVMRGDFSLAHHEVTGSDKAIAVMRDLCKRYDIVQIVMGDRTTSKAWYAKLQSAFDLPINLVDERNSTLEARDRYWRMYPPRGLTRLLPHGMRVPPRPVDDIVAILLIERYLQQVV